MTRKVLGKAEITEAQKLLILNVFLLFVVFASIAIGVYFTIGKDLVLIPIIVGMPAIIIVMINIGFLHKK